jgi:outer membrane protein assembly factor BamB
LAASLGAFGGILWTILPHPAPAGRGGITVADQDPPATDRIPFRTVWEWTGQGEIAGLTLEEGILVVSGSSSLQVTGVDRTSGRVEWKFALPGAPAPSWPPAAAQGVPEEVRQLEADLRQINARIDERLKSVGPGPETAALQKKRSAIREQLRVASSGDNLYLVSGQLLYCLDRLTGVLKWTRHLGFVPTARPVAIRNFVFLSDAAAGRVRVLDVEKQGKEVTSYEGPVAGGVAYADPLVTFAGSDGFLRAFRVTDGKLVWKVPVVGAMRADPVIEVVRHVAQDGSGRASISRMVFAAAGSTLNAVDLDSARFAWQFDCGAPITSGPVRKDDLLYVGTEAALSALEILPQAGAAGRLRWKLTGGERFVLKSGDLVVVQDAKGQWVTVREPTGEVVGRFSAGDYAHVATNPVDALLYAAKRGGRVVCLAEGR